jgi:hypothetical protein
LFIQAGKAETEGSIGDALDALAREPVKNPLAAIVLLRRMNRRLAIAERRTGRGRMLPPYRPHLAAVPGSPNSGFARPPFGRPPNF